MSTTETHEPSISRTEGRPLAGGEREHMIDVRTQDMEVNMGPQHPATHGVMRVLVRADGELITGAQPHLGYLHRCAEKIGESVEWLQYLPYTDRYDYLAAMNNNLGYSMAVEKLMGIEIPRRAMMLRTICAELNRIGSHLIAIGTYGLDIGAFTPFLYMFREREWMMALFEKICGARLTYSYIRIGGVFNDAPPGWLSEVEAFCDTFEVKWREYYDLLIQNHIFVKRTADIGVITREMTASWPMKNRSARWYQAPLPSRSPEIPQETLPRHHRIATSTRNNRASGRSTRRGWRRNRPKVARPASSADRESRMAMRARV